MPEQPAQSDQTQPAASDAPERRGSLWKRLGPAGPLGIAWTVMPALAGIFLLSELGAVAEFLQGLPGDGLALYIAVFIIAAGLGMLPTYSQAILGGWVFGVAVGLPAALAGFLGGSLVGYGVARFIAKDRVARVIDSNAKAKAIADALVHRGFLRTAGMVALLRVPPNSPFALTNLAMAAARTPLMPFAIGTLIGMTPRTAIAVAFAAAGAANGRDIQDLGSKAPWMLAVGVASLLIVLAVVSIIGNRAINRVLAQRQPEPSAIP